MVDRWYPIIFQSGGRGPKASEWGEGIEQKKKTSRTFTLKNMQNI